MFVMGIEIVKYVYVKYFMIKGYFGLNKNYLEKYLYYLLIIILNKRYYIK